MKNNRKKCIVIATSPYGNSLTNYWQTIVEELTKRNYFLVVIFDQKYDFSQNNSSNVTYYYWPSLRPVFFKDFLFYARVIRKYKPIASISNFGSTNVLAIIGLLSGVKNRLNYIHTTIDQIELDNNDKLKNLLLRYRKFVIYRLHTHFLTNSNGTLLNYSREFRIKKYRITVLNILLVPAKKYYSFNERKLNKIILVGRLHKSKGHVPLIHQFQKVISESPDLELHIIGAGPELNIIKNEIQKLKVTKNVLLRGNIPHKDILNEFESALISISSSIHEAYGLVNIEALKCGTPIISTKTAGGLEIVTDKYNGRFIDLNDQNSLLKSIRSIRKNWNYYSQNALDTFNNRFHEKCVYNHVNKIETIINNYN